jgi:hypothetical protein
MAVVPIDFKRYGESGHLNEAGGEIHMMRKYLSDNDFSRPLPNDSNIRFKLGTDQIEYGDNQVFEDTTAQTDNS